MEGEALFLFAPVRGPVGKEIAQRGGQGWSGFSQVASTNPAQ